MVGLWNFEERGDATSTLPLATTTTTVSAASVIDIASNRDAEGTSPAVGSKRKRLVPSEGMDDDDGVPSKRSRSVDTFHPHQQHRYVAHLACALFITTHS